MKRTEAGLTMTEALVTLAVVGVLMVVGLPSLGDFLENGQLSSDTNDLFASLMMARSEAVTLNQRVTICKIDPSAPTTCANGESWQSGWIAFEDTDLDAVRDGGEDILDTYTGMTANSSVTATNFTNTVTYLPSGATTTNGSFTICINGNVAQDIIVNATGRPRIADSACP